MLCVRMDHIHLWHINMHAWLVWFIPCNVCTGVQGHKSNDDGCENALTSLILCLLSYLLCVHLWHVGCSDPSAGLKAMPVSFLLLLVSVDDTFPPVLHFIGGLLPAFLSLLLFLSSIF